MHVLIADKLPDSCISSLQQSGHKVSIELTSGQSLSSALARLQPQVLIVRSTKVTADMVQGTHSLELIVRAGAGYDSIDVAAASERGVFVANCPGKNASAVAELTIGLMVALDRRIPENVSEARRKNWQKARFAKADGLRDRTLGVVGLGKIGSEVARVALAMGMHVVAWSRSLTEAHARTLGVTRALSPVEVAASADIITMHVAATPDTRRMAGKDFFAAMKPGALFINTTRGSVVDEEALHRAMEEKGILAGLDVFDSEPAYKEGELRWGLAAHNSVYLTHHIGASTRQAQEATAAEAVRIINWYAQKGSVPNCVNLAAHTSATHLLTVRHLDRVGVLAAVLDVIRKSNLNVQEMENQVFAGEKAAVARIRVTGEPPPGLLHAIGSANHVLAADLITL